MSELNMFGRKRPSHKRYRKVDRHRRGRDLYSVGDEDNFENDTDSDDILIDLEGESEVDSPQDKPYLNPNGFFNS